MPNRRRPNRPLEVSIAENARQAFRGSLSGYSSVPQTRGLRRYGGAGSAGTGVQVQFYQDQFTVSSSGPQTLQLTYVPVEHSEHLLVHAPGAVDGLYQRGATWTRPLESNVITTNELLAVSPGDVIVVEYAYYGAAVATLSLGPWRRGNPSAIFDNPSGANSAPKRILYADGQFFVVGDSGWYATNSNPVNQDYTQAQVTGPTGNYPNFYNSAYGNSTWIAAGTGNTTGSYRLGIYVNDGDGFTYVQSLLGDGLCYSSVHGDGTWAVMDYYGRLYRTTDPRGAWAEVSRPWPTTAVTSPRVAYGNGQWVVSTVSAWETTPRSLIYVTDSLSSPNWTQHEVYLPNFFGHYCGAASASALEYINDRWVLGGDTCGALTTAGDPRDVWDRFEWPVLLGWPPVGIMSIAGGRFTMPVGRSVTQTYPYVPAYTYTHDATVTEYWVAGCFDGTIYDGPALDAMTPATVEGSVFGVATSNLDAVAFGQNTLVAGGNFGKVGYRTLE